MAAKIPEPAALLATPSRHVSEEPASRASVPPPDLKAESKLRSPSVEPSAAIAAAKSPEPVEEETETESVEADDDEGTTTIDMDTFHQILDLDEDDTHDFSRGMAWAYFSQASSTFDDMDEAFEKKDLVKLSSLGHFLKGSSAALGVAKVQASCEKIQHYGQQRDEESGNDLTSGAALDKIKPLLSKVKVEYAAAEKWLKEWYKENAAEEEPDS